MKIGILACDKVADIFSSEHGQYPDMFIDLLGRADPTLTFATYDVIDDEFPPNIDACDAYLITGSHHGVNDELPWIAKLEAFIHALHIKNKKLIGICFGHQLIAKALGGQVGKSAHCWTVGIVTNKTTQKNTWMGPANQAFNLIASHQDQIITPPPETEILASNATCPFYMIKIKNSISLQGHPEFSKAYSEALMTLRQDSLGDACYKQGLKSLELNKDDALVARWIINFLQEKIVNITNPT